MLLVNPKHFIKPQADHKFQKGICFYTRLRIFNFMAILHSYTVT